jgi:hypothetical protein
MTEALLVEPLVTGSVPKLLTCPEADNANERELVVEVLAMKITLAVPNNDPVATCVQTFGGVVNELSYTLFPMGDNWVLPLTGPTPPLLTVPLTLAPIFNVLIAISFI